jgi:hypothetical protein
MGEVKHRILCEMDGIVDTMGLNEVGGKIEIEFGDADRID